MFTIGFTKKTAEVFFTKLMEAGVKRLIDTRLNNVSQLAGFAKRDDLQFFLKTVGGIEYIHELAFAPTQEMLDDFKNGHGDWKIYEKQFLKLMKQRKIEDLYPKEFYEDACLLCSEDKPHHCHRRLVAEYLNLNIVHL
ncbi:MAG: DUF488 domain-containing protein [Bdellovibrionota bacterium]